jgi:uncharacterized protein YoaH (UPF0181 family)
LSKATWRTIAFIRLVAESLRANRAHHHRATARLQSP